MPELSYVIARVLPCGANWRYSRFSVVRRLGDWWLPLWGGLAFREQPSDSFGECAACFNALERPFWDTYCFDCQDSLDDDEWTEEQVANASMYGVCLACRTPRQPLLKEIPRSDEWAHLPPGAEWMMVCPKCESLTA
jgi:hypothetical protein